MTCSSSATRSTTGSSTAGTEHEAFSALPGMRERTILLGGFSKAYAMTGWRIGYACAPADLLDGILKVHQYIIMSAPTTAQDAALVALDGRRGGRGVEAMVAEYDRRRRMFVAGLGAHRAARRPSRAAPSTPSRASPAAACRARSSASDSSSSTGVAVIPGSAFGPGGEGYVRASLATSYEKLEEALRRIERFLGPRSEAR